MHRVRLEIDPDTPHKVTLQGTTTDVAGLLAAVSRLLDAPSGKPQEVHAADLRFRDVFRRAAILASTDRDFAALVAAYRKARFDDESTSADVRRLAAHVKKSLANPAMALRQALEAQDVRRTTDARPFRYACTERGWKKWRDFMDAKK